MTFKGHRRFSEIAQFDTMYTINNELFAVDDLISLYHFPNTARFWFKIRNFLYPTLPPAVFYVAVNGEGILSEIRDHVWNGKTRTIQLRLTL